MKTRWDSWDVGRKLVFLSVCLGFLTVFMPWQQDPIGPRGLDKLLLGTPPWLFLLYAPFAYPALALWSGGAIHTGLGVACAVFGMVLAAEVLGALGYVLSGPAAGAHAYLVSILGLAAGVLLHRRSAPRSESRPVSGEHGK